MAKKRRKFQRRPGKRRYRRLFIISAEGTKTEPQYFGMFNSRDAVIHVNCLKGKRGSSPPQVLRRMRNHLKDTGLKPGDEAWLVVDKDQWTDEQLAQLHQWAQTAENYGFALSNPKFEYWLLLHFEDGSGVSSSRACTERLKKHLPNFEKGNVEVEKLKAGIPEAIRRAKQKDSPPCTDWPRTTGTTVYRLVEKLLNTGN